MGENQHIRKQIIWLTTLRVVVISTLLAAAMLIQFIRGEFFIELNPIYYLVGAVYILTIIYVILFTRIRKSFELFTYLQFTGDLLIITTLIFFSGGILSPFHVLYILIIIAASTMLFRRGGVFVASGSFILYGILVNLLYHNVIRTPGGILLNENETFSTYDAYYNLFVAFIGFYSTALLSSYITERLRQTDKSLKETSGNLEELLLFHENIINSMVTGLITTSLDGSITSYNRAAEEITGLAYAEVKNRRIETLFLPEDRSKKKEYTRNNHGSGAASYFEFEFPTGTESRKYLGVTLSNFYDRLDRLVGYIYMFQDLTEIKNLEREVGMKERMAAVGELAAAMAHEIRNPLASMSGSIQMLRGSAPTGSDDAALMEIFLRESERLNRIIEDFLFYARPTPTILIWISLDELLEDTFMLLKHSSEIEENQNVRLHIDGRSTFRCLADPNKIKQVVWNLARNAFKAMPDGGLLEISLTKDDSERFILAFRDQGVGMKPEEIHKCFQPFHGKFSGGTGLGLAIVYRIIKDHTGDVSVTSSPKGTTLTITLPPAPKEPRQRTSPQ